MITEIKINVFFIFLLTSCKNCKKRSILKLTLQNDLLSSHVGESHLLGAPTIGSVLMLYFLYRNRYFFHLKTGFNTEGNFGLIFVTWTSNYRKEQKKQVSPFCFVRFVKEYFILLFHQTTNVCFTKLVIFAITRVIIIYLDKIRCVLTHFHSAM